MNKHLHSCILASDFMLILLKTVKLENNFTELVHFKICPFSKCSKITMESEWGTHFEMN